MGTGTKPVGNRGVEGAVWDQIRGNETKRPQWINLDRRESQLVVLKVEKSGRGENSRQGEVNS